jgi:hypothetical protein
LHRASGYTGAFLTIASDLAIATFAFLVHVHRYSHAITKINNWISSSTIRYDFLCPERHTGLQIPELLKAANHYHDWTAPDFFV